MLIIEYVLRGTNKKVLISFITENDFGAGYDDHSHNEIGANYVASEIPATSDDETVPSALKDNAYDYDHEATLLNAEKFDLYDSVWISILLDEQCFEFVSFERHEKFLMLDFGALDCEGGFTVSDQSCMIVNEGCDFKMDEADAVKECESILKKQFQIIQDLRQTEASMPTFIDYFDAVETMTSAPKFICAPPLENNVYGYGHGATSLHAEMFGGGCVSLMNTLNAQSANAAAAASVVLFQVLSVFWHRMQRSSMLTL